MSILSIIGYIVATVVAMFVIVVMALALTIHNYVWSKAGKNENTNDL